MKSLLLVPALAASVLVGCRDPLVPARASLAPPQVSPPTMVTLPALLEAVGAAERAGSGQAALVAQGLLAEGERVGAFVNVPDDECLLVMARGSASVTDVDLVLWSDEGEWLAGDERRDAEPAVILCEPHPRRVHAMGVVAAGRGQLAMAAQRVPRAQEASVRAWLVSLRPEASRPDPPGRRVLVHANPDTPTLVPIDVDAGFCLEVHAAGSGGTVEPDAVLLDAMGVVRTRAVLEAGDGTGLRACVREAFHGSLAVRSRLGQGDVVLGIQKEKRPVWLREGRRIDELGSSSAPLEGLAQQKPVKVQGAFCTWFEAPLEGRCELARRDGSEVMPLPAALCTRAGELRCADGVSPQTTMDVRFDGDESLDEKHAMMLERAIESLGDAPARVRVWTGRAGDLVVVPSHASEGAPSSLLGAMVIVREARRRFVVRAFDKTGPLLHQASGIGDVVLATVPAGRGVTIEAAGLDDGEAFIVVEAWENAR